MPKIELSRGLVAIVDPQDLPLVRPYHWFAHEAKPGIFYARARIGGKRVYLHRYILTTERGIEVGFANGNPLDCRRANLSQTTLAEKNAARRKTTVGPQETVGNVVGS